MNSRRLLTCCATLLFVGSLSTLTEKPGNHLLLSPLTNRAQAAVQPYSTVQPEQINDLQALAEYQAASLPLYTFPDAIAKQAPSMVFEQIHDRQTLAQYQATLTIGASTLSK